MITKSNPGWQTRIAYVLVGILIGFVVLGWMIWNPWFASRPAATPAARATTAAIVPTGVPSTPLPAQLPPTTLPPSADELWQRANNCQCLTLYTHPETGAPIILKAIESAQKSIRLKMYLFTRDDVQDALIAAARRGVDVRVLMELNPSGGQATNVVIFDAMKNTPVKFRWTSFDFRFSHEKSLVIDDKLAYIMTHNITASSFNTNREYGVIDTIPADVSEVIRVYEADWEKIQPDLTSARLVWSPVNARQRWVELINSAQTSLDIEQNAWGAPEIVDRVIDALKRGVVVRAIFSPNYPIESDIDEPNRDLIRRSGAQVKYMSRPYVHAKMFLVDGKRAFVGSENVTNNSLDNNRELGIIFDQTDAVATIRETFQKDWGIATNEPFPISDIAIPASGVVNWEDADRFYNREVTVEGTVVKIYNSGRVIWLQMSDDRAKMKAVIFPQDYNKFPDRPDRYFFGKTIRVTGRVQEYEGAPEIIVN
ncbi:MAG TPA: phospholipase D-like domain-containing protein, partial [Anaerolineae bacterium]